jgi:hypothetical protein
MKKTIQRIALGSFALAITIAGCKKDNPKPGSSTTPRAYTSGVFITNEGSFGSGTGTVSFYDRANGSVSSDIFQAANNFPLGNIVQSINIHNGKGYIVVNNSNKVEVVNAGNFSSVGTITGLSLPRYFFGINNLKGYITEWGPTGSEGAVQVIDLSTNSISKTIYTGKGAENMLRYGNTLYVTCRGGYGNDSIVTVIDIVNDAVLTSFIVGPNPNGIELDANGKIWVLCGGKWNSSFTQLEQTGKLVRINPATNTIEQAFTFSSLFSTPATLCMNGAKNKLYFTYDGGVYTHDITATSLNSGAFFTGYFYGLGVDPTNDYAYAADAGNFSSNGYVYRFSPSGNKVDSFEVGMVPGNFFFK